MAPPGLHLGTLGGSSYESESLVSEPWNLQFKASFQGDVEALEDLRTISLVCVCTVTQLCPTLWDHTDWSPPGSSLHGIVPARTLEGLPFPPLGDPPDPGIEPTSPGSPVLAGGFFTTKPLGKPSSVYNFLESVGAL